MQLAWKTCSIAFGNCKRNRLECSKSSLGSNLKAQVGGDGIPTICEGENEWNLTTSDNFIKWNKFRACRDTYCSPLVSAFLLNFHFRRCLAHTTDAFL